MSEISVVVAGDGLAGLTAGLFAARNGRSTIVFGTATGGEALSVETIEDFPGYADSISGYELCPAVFRQAAEAGAEFRMAEIQDVKRNGSSFAVDASDGDVLARTLIVATGTELDELGVPGERALQGRGISHCASCDGPLFAGKVVGVVGSGDHAAHEALTLAKYVAHVVLFDPSDGLEVQETYRQRVLASDAITVHHRTNVEEILGESAVSGVRVRDSSGGEVFDTEISGLFTYGRARPRTGLLNGLVRLDSRGYIETDTQMRTSVPGVFAAGTVRSNAVGHAVTSAGDGATAAVTAHRYLLELDDPKVGWHTP